MLACLFCLRAGSQPGVQERRDGIPKQASERLIVSTFQRLACLLALSDELLAWDPSGLEHETSWLETL